MTRRWAALVGTAALAAAFTLTASASGDRSAMAGASGGRSAMARVAVIDDAQNGAAMLDRFEYIGAWQHVRGKFDGRSFGTSTRSTHLGDVAIVRFDGTRIRLYGVRGPSGGRAGVALDFVSTGAPVDFYAPTIIPHALIFASRALPPGVHTLSIAVWGVRDERARSYYVNIDDAQVDAQSVTVGRAEGDATRER